MNRATMHRIINCPEKCAGYIRKQPGAVSREWSDDRGTIAEFRAVVSGAAFYAQSVNGEFYRCGVEYSAPVGFLTFNA